MGKELTTLVRIDTRETECKVLLESGEIICRGALKRRFSFGDMKGLRAKAGWVEFRIASEAIAIKVGDKAGAWVEAIKNPRTRIQKLGVEHGMKVCVIGKADAEGLAELKAAIGSAPARRVSKGADVVLLFAAKTDELDRLPIIEASLGERGAVWVLWPKGRTDFSHDDVVTAATAAGLSQTKSMGYSETLTGLRLVRRAKPGRSTRAR